MQEKQKHHSEDRKPTTKRKLYVWWHYHWKLLLIVFAALILLTVILISQFKKRQPDYQIAVISSDELPVDTQNALIQELKAYCTDVNKDGRILIQLNSYRADFGDKAVDNDAYDQMSGTIRLYSDLQSEHGSYIFLIRDPEGFEDTTRILQYLDGSSPASEEASVNVWEMCYKWDACPVLAGLSLGSYRGLTLMDNETGESQDVMSDFYIGRKILSSDEEAETYKADELLWQTLTDGASASGEEKS